MNRRRLLAGIAGWSATGALAQDDAPRPRQRISARELDRALADRFPLVLGLPGVFDARLDVPRLRLMPGRQRLGATLPVTARDVAGTAHGGEVDAVFALRYEAADRTLRATDVQVAAVRSAELRPEELIAWRSLLGDLIREGMPEIVLHRFQPGDLALADALGVEPERIEVTADGLVVWFGPPTRR